MEPQIELEIRMRIQSDTARSIHPRWLHQNVHGIILLIITDRDKRITAEQKLIVESLMLQAQGAIMTNPKRITEHVLFQLVNRLRIHELQNTG